MKKFKKNQGITLIALVVTIIVLIILAGVSISMLVGDNGIITQAQKAKADTEQAALKEKLDLIALERELNQSITTTDVADETDIFLEMMGDKEITQEDIISFNETLQSYGKQLTGISSTVDIQKIGTDASYPLDGLYVLLENVSLQGQNWTPIGTEEEPFTGVLNGNNKEIDGLSITNPEMNAGLFGVNSGSVKNIALTNISVDSEHSIVGGIAGQNNGLIDNCHVQSGAISGTGNDMYQDVYREEPINVGSRVGGITGMNNDGGVIQNCTNASTVTAEYSVAGGICGFNVGGDVRDCENTGEIHGVRQVGGIVGNSVGLSVNNISCVSKCINYADISQSFVAEEEMIAEQGGIIGYNARYSTVENCYNEGNITGECGRMGGIVGCNIYTVIHCENKGDVSNTATISSLASEWIGGIVGYNIGSIMNSQNYGNIEASTSVSSFVGGIAGSTSKSDTTSVLPEIVVEECFNVGNISGNIYVGGIAGRCGSNASLISCYNTGNVSGTQRVGGIIGDTVAGSLEAKNLYNKGTVTATTNYVGGIVGVLYNILENAYNTGTVSMSGSNTNYGGIIGYINTTSSSIDKVQNCYYLNMSTTKAVGNISTIDTSSSRTSDEMKNLADTLGDGFKTSTDGDGYPKLVWE